MLVLPHAVIQHKLILLGLAVPWPPSSAITAVSTKCYRAACAKLQPSIPSAAATAAAAAAAATAAAAAAAAAVILGVTAPTAAAAAAGCDDVPQASTVHLGEDGPGLDGHSNASVIC